MKPTTQQSMLEAARFYGVSIFWINELIPCYEAEEAETERVMPSNSRSPLARHLFRSNLGVFPDRP